MGVVDPFHAVHVHDDEAERRDRARVEGGDVRLELRVEAALDPKAAQLIDRQEAFELGRLRVSEWILLELEDGLPEKQAIADTQARPAIDLSVDERPVGAPAIDDGPVAAAAVFDARVPPGHVVVVELELAGRVATDVDRLLEHDARAHVLTENDDQRRRDRLPKLALQRRLHSIGVDPERFGAERSAPPGRPRAAFRVVGHRRRAYHSDAARPATGGVLRVSDRSWIAWSSSVRGSTI